MMTRAATLILTAAVAAMPLLAVRTHSDRVDVCVNSPVRPLIAEQAQLKATEIFRPIGVRLDWHTMRGCPSGAIVIRLREDTPSDLKPGALAYALPYEGTHIEVFYDRVMVRSGSEAASALLAYVMVHEITHILQGVCRHSETGIMKANWTNQEIAEIALKPLHFQADDVEMIHMGIERREARVAFAGSLTQNAGN